MGDHFASKEKESQEKANQEEVQEEKEEVIELGLKS